MTYNIGAYFLCRIHDEVPHCKLKGFIDERSGILESGFDSKTLCYFEVDDLNLEQPVSLQDLVAAFSLTEGIRVRYQVSFFSCFEKKKSRSVEAPWWIANERFYL